LPSDACIASSALSSLVAKNTDAATSIAVMFAFFICLPLVITRYCVMGLITADKKNAIMAEP
jgi:hypothetical protein